MHTIANVRSYYYYHVAKMSTIFVDLNHTRQIIERANIPWRDIDSRIAQYVRDGNTEKLEELSVHLKIIHNAIMLTRKADAVVQSMAKIDEILEIVGELNKTQADVLLDVWGKIHEQNMDIEEFSLVLHGLRDVADPNERSARLIKFATK